MAKFLKNNLSIYIIPVRLLQLKTNHFSHHIHQGTLVIKQQLRQLKINRINRVIISLVKFRRLHKQVINKHFLSQ